MSNTTSQRQISSLVALGTLCVFLSMVTFFLITAQMRMLGSHVDLRLQVQRWLWFGQFLVPAVLFFYVAWCIWRRREIGVLLRFSPYASAFAWFLALVVVVRAM